MNGTKISRFHVGMWFQKCKVEAVEMAAEKSASVTWIVSPRMNFEQHASLHQCRIYDMHFIYGAAQGNDSHLTHVQQLSSLLKGYTKMCVMLFLPLKEFCDIIHSPYNASKYETIYSRTTPDDDAQMFSNPADSKPRIVIWASVPLFHTIKYMKCMSASTTLL